MKYKVKNGRLNFSNDVFVVESYSFQGREDIAEVIIPDWIEKIEVGAFSACINLSKVILPKRFRQKEDLFLVGLGWHENLVSKYPGIEGSVFDECPNLREILIGGKKIRTECLNGSCIEIVSRRNLNDIEVTEYQYFGSIISMWAASNDKLSVTEETSMYDAIEKLRANEGKRLNKYEFIIEQCKNIQKEMEVISDDIRNHVGLYQNKKDQAIVENYLLTMRDECGLCCDIPTSPLHEQCLESKEGYELELMLRKVVDQKNAIMNLIHGGE